MSRHDNWVGGAAALLAIAAMVMAVVAVATEAHAAEDAFGVWQHPENGSLIETYPCGPGLCARIEKIADGQTTDHRNVDPEQRGRPILGLVIVSQATREGPDSWSGRIYNRIDGRTYEGRLTLKDRDRLELTGCTAVVICRTVSWRRAP